jgi:hypothetical protein
LPVSRLAEGTGAVEPLAARVVGGAKPHVSQRAEPEAQFPTISSATPIPTLQRQLALVPEHRPRSAVFPPPFTVELPVLAGAEPELSPAAALPFDGSPPVALPVGHQQIGGLPTASASSPDPLAVDPEPVAGQPEALGAEPAEPTAPLSGFAERILSLTHPPEDSALPAATPGPLTPLQVQRLLGSATPASSSPAVAKPPGGRAGTPPAASAQSPEHVVVPTVSDMTPLLQRTADHIADPGAAPAAVSPPLPVAPPGTHQPGNHSPRQPLDTAPPESARTLGRGPDFEAPSGGPRLAADTALPLVARMTSTEPPTTPPPTPSPSTATAALVSSRPPLAVPADLSSAVAPPPAVQRVSYTGPGQPRRNLQSEAPAVVQRQLASPGTPALGDVAENPVSVEVLRQSVTDEPPVVAARDSTGLAGRRMEPIPVQRRSVSTAVSQAATPLPTAAAGPAGGSASGMPPTIGQTRSFAAMFAGTSAVQSAGEVEDHPGYTTVQLQSATEPSTTSPAPEEPTAAPAAEPPVETAAPPPATASAAGAVAAAPTAGAAAADLDEMARRLFEPLSARLRAELWLDRERAGLVTDARY